MTAKIEAWRALLISHVADGRQLLRGVLAGPLRFTPHGKTYRFEGEAAIGAIGSIVAWMAGLSPFEVPKHAELEPDIGVPAPNGRTAPNCGIRGLVRLAGRWDGGDFHSEVTSRGRLESSICTVDFGSEGREANGPTRWVHEEAVRDPGHGACLGLNRPLGTRSATSS